MNPFEKVVSGGCCRGNVSVVVLPLSAALVPGSGRSIHCEADLFSDRRPSIGPRTMQPTTAEVDGETIRTSWMNGASAATDAVGGFKKDQREIATKRLQMACRADAGGSRADDNDIDTAACP
jgi:Tfp pilus assembly major pilin PilA